MYAMRLTFSASYLLRTRSRDVSIILVSSSTNTNQAADWLKDTERLKRNAQPMSYTAVEFIHHFKPATIKSNPSPIWSETQVNVLLVWTFRYFAFVVVCVTH